VNPVWFYFRDCSLHLAGCKKVQQVLAKPGELERFVHSETSCAELRDVFAGLFTLDKNELLQQHGGEAGADEAFHQIKQRALDNPSRYVMKPQREGGGNNIYNEAIPKAFNEMSEEELAAYILMERIFPSTQMAVLLRAGQFFEVTDETYYDFGI
jgi:hypothetical protein